MIFRLPESKNEVLLLAHHHRRAVCAEDIPLVFCFCFRWSSTSKSFFGSSLHHNFQLGTSQKPLSSHPTTTLHHEGLFSCARRCPCRHRCLAHQPCWKYWQQGPNVGRVVVVGVFCRCRGAKVSSSLGSRQPWSFVMSQGPLSVAYLFSFRIQSQVTHRRRLLPSADPHYSTTMITTTTASLTEPMSHVISRLPILSLPKDKRLPWNS